MKKFTLLSSAVLMAAASFGQLKFDPSIDVKPFFATDEVVVPPSPIKFQVVFIGGEDMVQTLDNNGSPNGETPAKQWHDFIGFTPDTAEGSTDLGWVSVNHEMIASDDKIGDGGGMTAFKIKRDEATDSLIIVEQTLTDGRTGKFFNVDFVNTVGETGMNCGGINGPDGRIWTAEEWFRTSTASIFAGGNGVRDTADWTIDSDLPGNIDNAVIPKFENFNYMVEIDPREAKAIRKQYNWGRQGFEGGAFTQDGKTVYLGVDGTPCFWLKFEATTAGDYTDGQLYVYKHNGTPKWIAVDNEDLSIMRNLNAEATSVGATMYNRIEWVVEIGGKFYMAETGRDNPGGRWSDEAAGGAVYAPHHSARASAQGVPNPGDGDYWDYYGRILEFDPATDEMSVFLEAGPDLTESSTTLTNYPDVHLSNPDGLNKITIGEQDYMIICEDLNGTSFGRVPAGISNRTCELYLLDMSVDNPTLDDLIRISVGPIGAEITGAIGLPDGKTILVNSQHPSGDNPFPFNNSLTYALTGFDADFVGLLDEPQLDKEGFDIYPNPATRIVRFNQTTDVAIYSITGTRIRVERNVQSIDISTLERGTYFLRNLDGETKKLIVQ